MNKKEGKEWKTYIEWIDSTSKEGKKEKRN
jgi:hypothetical protein